MTSATLLTRLAAPAALLLLAACDNLTGVACTTDVKPAIVVEIRDARTGAAIAAEAQGTVTDGAYSDQLTPYEGGLEGPSTLFSRQAALERPGTYAVHVTHAGYLPWNASGVAVSDGRCHVRTKRLQANLQPVVN